MPVNEFVCYLSEVFERFGPIQARKMFGGYGIFREGVMFGLVADDTLYLKSDETIVSHFEAHQLKQFKYRKKDKMVKMSYYMAPDEIFDDLEVAAAWAARSFEVAYRSRNTSRGKK